MTERDKVINGLECCLSVTKCGTCPYNTGHDSWCGNTDKLLEDALAMVKAQEPITGETSDGYHTFNELYHHRAVLFSVIVANYKERAWKSVRHHDGTMYDGMFIVGIDTPDGQATYHYDINPYWDMFNCKVREFAPEWDGHTPAQAIERIKSLALLKAQEPRVMMLEEVKAFEWDYCYLEQERQPGKEYRMIVGDYVLTCITWPCIASMRIVHGDDSYGVKWRCWDKKPTDEQRENTPWMKN